MNDQEFSALEARYSALQTEFHREASRRQNQSNAVGMLAAIWGGRVDYISIEMHRAAGPGRCSEQLRVQVRPGCVGWGTMAEALKDRVEGVRC